MLEIELKCPVADLNEVRHYLDTHGWDKLHAQDEVDAYFNAPDRDFGQTDEAMRLRRIGAKNILTYKGPKVDAVSKTRKECEVRLQDGPETAAGMWEIMTALRYRLTAEVRKHRTTYQPARPGRYDIEVCLDDVVDVGQFVELEIKAPATEREAALQYLQELAREMGLHQSERRSYLELLLTQKTGG
jgi:adenylate cyclase class 2